MHAKSIRSISFLIVQRRECAVLTIELGIFSFSFSSMYITDTVTYYKLNQEMNKVRIISYSFNSHVVIVVKQLQLLCWVPGCRWRGWHSIACGSLKCLYNVWRYQSHDTDSGHCLEGGGERIIIIAIQPHESHVIHKIHPHHLKC